MADPVKPATPGTPTKAAAVTTPAPPKPSEAAPAVQGRAPNPAPTTDNPEEDIPESAHAHPGVSSTSQQFEGPKDSDTPQPLANPGVAGGVKYPEPAYQPPPASKTGASYRLLAPHYLVNDKYMEADQIVTEGINIPKGWVPSLSVEPLNDAAKAAYRDRHEGKPKSVDEGLAKAAPTKDLPK